MVRAVESAGFEWVCGCDESGIRADRLHGWLVGIHNRGSRVLCYTSGVHVVCMWCACGVCVVCM